MIFAMCPHLSWSEGDMMMLAVGWSYVSNQGSCKKTRQTRGVILVTVKSIKYHARILNRC